MKRRDKITGDILIVLSLGLAEGHYKENRGKATFQNDRGWKHYKVI